MQWQGARSFQPRVLAANHVRPPSPQGGGGAWTAAGAATGAGNEADLSARRWKREQLRQRLELGPDDAKSWTRLAQLQQELGEVEDFVAFAQDLCRRAPGAWRSTCRVLHQRLGRHLEATQILLEVHRMEPQNAEVCCYLAKLQSSQAAYWYGQALRANPSCVQALLALADSHRREENFGEAARLYAAAHREEPLPARALYHFGEALVSDGRTVEGRDFLMQALQDSDSTYHVHAAVKIALSHVMDQQHEDALAFCRRAEELHGQRSENKSTPELKLAQTLKGITLLRTGDVTAAVETLRGASCTSCGSDAAVSGGSRWDELVQQSLCLAETLRGDLVAAERHIDLAQRLAGGIAGRDVLLGQAYIKQAQGDHHGALGLLQRSLEVDKNSPLSLLSMGYLLLCQGKHEVAIQFLQKCLQQPAGTLSFGAEQRGAAHLYLCIAHHGLASGSVAAASPVREASHWFSLSPGPSPHSEGGPVEAKQLAKEHFHNGHALLPELRRLLVGQAATGGQTSPAAHLVSGTPPRMGLIDLSQEQAAVLVHYAQCCGLLPVDSAFSPGRPTSAATEDCRSPPWARAPRAGSAVCVRRLSAGFLEESPAKPGLSVGASGPLAQAQPTLVGTASTAVPTSASPSRNASELALFPDGVPLPAAPHGAGSQPSRSGTMDGAAATQVDLCMHLPPEKLWRFADVELGECISRGEVAIVHRGVMRSTGREVVVKMLHQKDCLFDQQAAAELRAEIAVIADLSHPRLVAFVGACIEEPTLLALITELAPGGNLHHALHVRRRQFSRAQRFQLATELLEGVRYLHARRPPVAHPTLERRAAGCCERWRHPLQLSAKPLPLSSQKRLGRPGRLYDPVAKSRCSVIA
mmetsp:Transcript_62693/g.134616  ORF Transcript_62693/g.134616 Transcript_62693/m.134616 type:complete len:868 (+) Transcript_62693:61-2664(+)